MISFLLKRELALLVLKVGFLQESELTGKQGRRIVLVCIHSMAGAAAQIHWTCTVHITAGATIFVFFTLLLPHASCKESAPVFLMRRRVLLGCFLGVTLLFAHGDLVGVPLCKNAESFLDLLLCLDGSSTLATTCSIGGKRWRHCFGGQKSVA
jgi:hypothetical protein